MKNTMLVGRRATASKQHGLTAQAAAFVNGGSYVENVVTRATIGASELHMTAFCRLPSLLFQRSRSRQSLLV